MKIEIIFDYIEDVVTEDGVIDRILRNDYIIMEAENIEEARIQFHKYCTGVITKINIIEERGDEE